MRSSSVYRSVLAFLTLLVLAVPLSAVDGKWSNLGPDGGSVFSLATAPRNPKVIYAGTLAGLFRSVDGGATWTYAGRGLGFGSAVHTIGVDPVQASTVYAGQDDGIFKSVNGGESWTRTGPSGVYSVAVDPRVSGTVFAASDQGLFRTGDGGATWRVLRGLPVGHRSTLVVIDPSAPRRVYAVIQDLVLGTQGLFKSNDGGNSWHPANRGLENQEIQVLTLDRRTPQTLYAGSGEGLFKSTDGGASWIRTGLEDSGRILALQIHTTQRNVVFAGSQRGLFRSQDGGTTWSRVSEGLPESGFFTALEFVPSSPQTLLVSVATHLRRGGVYRSVNGGTSWRLHSRGLTALSVSAAAVDPSNSNTLWMAANGVVFKSNDRGLAWLRIRTDPANTPVFLLVIDPLDPATVYVSHDNGDVRRTRDGGRTWELRGNPGVSTIDLVIDPANPSTLYAAGYGGIAKSTDGGATWTKLPGDASGDGNYYFDLAISPSSPSILYAVGGASGPVPRVLRSTDAGATWTRIEQGLPPGGSSFNVAVDPATPTTVYIERGGDLYRTLNGGETWTVFSSRFRNQTIKPLAVSPSRPGLLYAAVWFDNVYESRDGANRWEPLGESPGRLASDVLVADPQDPCRIYMGTRSRGLLAFTKEDCSP